MPANTSVTRPLEDLRAKPTFPVGKLSFWISLVVGQVVGFIVGPFFGGHVFLLMLFLQMLAAVLTFLILYGLLALNIVDALEQRNGMKMEKPRVMRGVLYTVFLPLVMCAFGFLAMLVQSHSSLHG